MEAGRISIGFGRPYVGLYSANGGSPTYSSGRRLARGVSVSIQPETSENNEFRADNVVAETQAGVFTGGTLTLTVDGLLQESECLIYGIPEPEDYIYGESKKVKMLKYGDDANIPYVGVGFIAEYMSGGVKTYVPVIIRKVQFSMSAISHSTEEKTYNWQKQELTATIMRDDSPNHDWKWLAEGQQTEAEAEEILKAVLNVTPEEP